MKSILCVFHTIQCNTIHTQHNTTQHNPTQKKTERLMKYLFFSSRPVWCFFALSTAGDGHHKSDSTLEKRNIVLRCYYAVPFLFAYCCVGAELFYVLLYVMHFYPHPILYQVSGTVLCCTVLCCTVLSCAVLFLVVVVTLWRWRWRWR